MTATGAIEAFWQTVDRAYGAYLDAVTGFEFLKGRIAQLQKRYSSSLKIPSEQLDSLSVIFGEGDPNSRDAVHLHAVSTRELKRRNRKDGENTLLMGSMCLVAIYQFWEDRFRAEVASELKLNRDVLTHDFFGDIRLIRNGILHHGGVAKPDIENCRQLKWFKAGDPIEINQNQMKEIVFTLRDICRHWIATRSAAAGAASHPADS